MGRAAPTDGRGRDTSTVSEEHFAWEGGPPQDDYVPSPGGWQPPPEVRPGWDWVPPPGATPNLAATPGWIRWLYRTPLLDRRAHELMWHRGGFLVLPPDHRWHSQHDV